MESPRSTGCVRFSLSFACRSCVFFSSYFNLISFYCNNIGEAEVKHARIAMLAVVGWIATDFGVRFPGAGEPYTSIPSAYMAHNTLVEQGTMGFLLLAIGLVEMCSGAALVQVSKGEIDREAGDFQFGSKLLEGKDAKAVLDMKTKEINNGRLAMLAFGGIATQTALGYESFPYF